MSNLKENETLVKNNSMDSAFVYLCSNSLLQAERKGTTIFIKTKQNNEENLFMLIFCWCSFNFIRFIPTASIHEEYTQYVEDGKSALRTLGLTIKEVEITQFDKNQITKILNDCDCIYVSGGNTFFLIQELRKTGTDKLIKEQVEMGKLYIGESAGTIILSPNIEYAKKMDDYLTLTPNFNDFTGLGIIDFYPVVHFNCFPFAEATRNIINEYGHLPLKPITNQQAIVITGDAVSILGKTSKTE